MATILMKCGHVALSRDKDGKPSCPICLGITPSAEEISEVIPDLTGRMAICSECKREAPSNLTLPFFAWRPKEEKDSFYDGCRGWD